MNAETPSRQVLDATIFRALYLLKAIGTNNVIRSKVAKAGLTDADLAEGWRLVKAASGYSETKPTSNPDDVKARDAIAQLDSWDEQGFRRVKAALTRLHPGQCEYVFDGLGPVQGPEVLLTVAEFVNRLDTLEAGRSDETREADKKAIETLATRGIDKAERTRLADLIKAAQSTPVAMSPEEEQVEAAAREANLEALYCWYSDWAETTRAVITRRDHLISLGLARRRAASKDEMIDPTAEPEIEAVPVA